MSRRVVITGVGPISGLGIGIDANWTAARQGDCAIQPIAAFDARGFDCRIAAEVPDFKINQFVPKHYRKATKVMARDIELAVAAADQAARDAGLNTPGVAAEGEERSYDPARVGCHIGADLIAADASELTAALTVAGTTADGPEGPFDMHQWGREGMNHLTPLWLLKYLPNMLACHVTITHDLRGPSNTITCNEASAGLSIGESLRVIQRNNADACFCGGGSSKVNLAAYFRQEMLGRLNATSNDAPAGAVRAFDAGAAGTVIGEGAGIVVLEAVETFEQRPDGRAYAEIAGFGAAQSFNPRTKNLTPEEDGYGMQLAIKRALKEAGVEPAAVDAIVAFGIGHAAWDSAEAAAYRAIFGGKLPAVVSFKSVLGHCGAASGGIDLCLAARMVHEQTLPAVLNRDAPLDGFNPTAPAAAAELNYVLCLSTGLGGQNAAVLIKRYQA